MGVTFTTKKFTGNEADLKVGRRKSAERLAIEEALKIALVERQVIEGDFDEASRKNLSQNFRTIGHKMGISVSIATNRDGNLVLSSSPASAEASAMKDALLAERAEKENEKTPPKPRGRR